MMHRYISTLAAVLTILAAAAPSSAQLAAPNSLGVTAGHVHINAADVDAQMKFWTSVGGTIVQREKITMVQFPGAYVLLRKQDSSGGTVGSTLNHFGIYVKDFPAMVAKYKAAGLAWEPGANPQVEQGFLTGPDGVRLEIYGNKTMATPVAMHHLHLNLVDPSAAQRWYGEHFGATPGKRLAFETATVPGAEITLSKTDAAQVPTKGRAVDHIGFEVKNIEAFVAKLQAAGIKTDGPIRSSTNASGLRLAFVTDPWGTEIEITEGLAATPLAP